MTQTELTHTQRKLKRDLKAMLVDPRDQHQIFDLNATTDILEAKNDNYHNEWFDLLNAINVATSDELLEDNSMKLSEEETQKVIQQAQVNKHTLCYNPEAIKHGVIKPLNNLSIWIMIQKLD